MVKKYSLDKEYVSFSIPHSLSTHDLNISLKAEN